MSPLLLILVAVLIVNVLAFRYWRRSERVREERLMKESARKAIEHALRQAAPHV